MTDTILIAANGRFTLGKGQSRPADEYRAIRESADDALGRWGTDLGAAAPGLVTAIYSGTSMLNRLLERRGARVGVVVTQGMEDYLRMERGVQPYLNYSLDDRLHAVTHVHNPPLIPRERIRGVPERIDPLGRVVIPLYETEARASVEALLAQDVEALCVHLLFSHVNPAHERAVRDIAREVMAGRGREVPVFLGSDIQPVRGDFPRLNALLAEAYAASPSRRQLQAVETGLAALGAGFELRVMASHGGTISVRSPHLVHTLFSGPIGGIVGARYLGETIGARNLVCTDVGGTSFDVGLITDGDVAVAHEPEIARFKFNLPMVALDSVGAGTGSFVRLDPATGRIQIGPDSAGARIGTSWEGGGLTEPTVTDCSVILGILNPDNFLGGAIRLDRARALAAFETQIAKPLGLDPRQAAAGILELLETVLRDRVNAMVLGRGFATTMYTLLAYGGGGPLHVAGYTEGLGFERVLIPSWAAAFSAFGCAAADYEYRHERSLDETVPPAGSADRPAFAARLNAVWGELGGRIAEDFSRSGIAPEQVRLRPFVRMKYRGQLDDLEIEAARYPLAGAADVDTLCAGFEERFERIYARAARVPEAGFTVTTVIARGAAAVEKPRLVARRLASAAPPAAAARTPRDVYWRGAWRRTPVWAMGGLRPGNVVRGPAVVEDAATTLAVPPGCRVRLDEWLLFHFERER